METKIVLGYAFGDEGKGVTTQWLCQEAIDEGKNPLVIRFSGGPQAAHTIRHEGVEHICSSFGSGVLLGVPTYLNEDVLIDPICLINEYDVLREKGFEPIIYVNNKCRVITPYDVVANITDTQNLEDGTCGKGVYKTVVRNNNGAPLTIEELMDVDLRRVRAFYNYNKVENLETMFFAALFKFFRIVKCVNEVEAIKDIDIYIFEGSQGLLLDADLGIQPNVTATKTGLNGIKPQYLQNAEVYLVTRTYLTRHGADNVPMKSLPWDITTKYETNVANKYQGEFHTGGFDGNMLYMASQRHCLDNYQREYDLSYNLVITHLDVVPDYKENYEEICEKVVDSICAQPFGMITFDNVYYNDSPESLIKDAYDAKQLYSILKIY